MRTVIVSRKWHESTITHKVVIDRDEIRIEMNLDEFLSCLAYLASSSKLTKPKYLILTETDEGKLQEALRRASSEVVEEMKRSTVGA